jgi:transcriptional regulator with XRE-family HTH domain
VSPESAAVPNPLQRMLGTYLRVERRRLGLDTVDIAEMLGLSDTYFRLVESGGAPLNQSLVFKLLEFLAARGAAVTSGPARVHFQRLALFLVGSHLVGAEMAALGGKRGSDLRAMEMLAKRDDDFRQFHQRTQRYYGLSEDQLKQFLHDDAALEVAAFLGNLAYARPTKEKENLVEKVLPSHGVLAMPTMNVEMVRRLIVDLSGRPFVHTPLLAAEWENRMAPTFKNVRGVYARTSMIISSKNLGMFLYPYLFERSCREVRFLFLESADPDVTKEQFIKQLNTARRAAGLDVVGRDHAKKLRIACVSDKDWKTLEPRFSELRRRTNLDKTWPMYDAYWSFDTTAEVPISFVGIEGTTSEDIWNLSLEESFAKRAEFDKLWGEILVDSK